MAVSLKDPQDGELGELTEINVTPFIDVMLVLLIIFMVAAPLSTVDVAVDLPVFNAQPQPRPDKPVFLDASSRTSRWRSATMTCRVKRCRRRSISRPTAIAAAGISACRRRRSPIVS